MSESNWNQEDLGPVDAYALAVAGGYTGTKAQWIEEIANASSNAQAAASAKTAAQEAAATASAAYGTDLLAPDYSTSSTYAVGAYVIHSGDLYRCITAVTTAGSWESNKNSFTAVDVGGEVSAQKSAINDLQNRYVVFDTIDGEFVKSTGQTDINAAYIRSDYISCEGLESITLIGIQTSTYYGAFYNANKEYVQGMYLASGEKTVIAVPSGASYYRVSGEKSRGWFSTVKILNLSWIDNTLTQQDKAADAKIVGEKVDALDETIDKTANDLQDNYLIFKTVDGQYIKSDGTVDNNNNFIRSDYISCDGLDSITIIGVQTRTPYGAFYDSNKEFVQLIDLTGGIENNIIVPSSARYYRISGEKSRGFFDTVKILAPSYFFDSKIELNRALIYGLLKQLTNNQEWMVGKYVDYQTGEIGDAYWWNAIEVKPSCEYIVTNANGASSGGIVFLNDEDEVLARYTNMGEILRTYSVPTNTAKIRLCYHRGSNADVVIIGSAVTFDGETLQSLYDAVAPNPKIFTVIGDSISSNLATGPVNYLAWPTMIIEKWKAQVTYQNLTYPGKRWHDGLILDCESVNSNADIVVCALGRNDIMHDYTLGNIAEIMALPLEQVTTDTLMGIYRKGLETLKNRLKNESIIVCVAPVTEQLIDSWETSPSQDRRAGWEELNNMRTAIRDFVIAEGGPSNGWIFIDGRTIFDVSELSQELYYGKKPNGDPDTTHPNICGQAVIASKIYDTIPPIGAIKASNYIES